MDGSAVTANSAPARGAAPAPRRRARAGRGAAPRRSTARRRAARGRRGRRRAIVRSSSWPRDRREHHPRSAGRQVVARSSSSTFARMQVSGVRSSCEASATSWRCASREPSSAASIALNGAPGGRARRRPPTSMRRCRSPVARPLGRGGRARPTGASGGARQRRAPVRRRRRRPRDQREQDPAQPAHRAVDSVSGLAICSVEPPGPRVVSTRACTPRRSRRAGTRRARRWRPRAPRPWPAAAAPGAGRMTSPWRA